MKTMLIYLGCIFYTLYIYTVLFMPRGVMAMIPAKVLAFPAENWLSRRFFKIN